MQSQDYDVIIIGAGISGICFAYRLQETSPELRYCILEAQNEIGGTWSFFKYPGKFDGASTHLLLLTTRARPEIRLGPAHFWIPMAALDRQWTNCQGRSHRRLHAPDDKGCRNR